MAHVLADSDEKEAGDRMKSIIVDSASPTSPKLFKHQPLDLSKTQIRLFRLLPFTGDHLKGIITIHDFDDCPKYKALSYTWGPPSPNREILISNQAFNIRENLWQFLDSCHRKPSELFDYWLWIDQICIDQSTVGERNHQVRLMAQIYRKASSVLVWLGVEADGSDAAMDAINDSMRTLVEACKDIEDLFKRPYWQRLWILQEVLLGENIVVHCGKKSFPWWKLNRLLLSPRPWKEQRRTRDWLNDVSEWKCMVEINRIARVLVEEKADFDGKGQRLSYMLGMFGILECQDVRDKVYGLLSLVRDSGTININYSESPFEVWCNAMAWIVVDESFMEFRSHWDVGKRLRDTMRLYEITDQYISNFLTELFRVHHPNKKHGISGLIA
jgi:hypothetical protein